MERGQDPKDNHTKRGREEDSQATKDKSFDLSREESEQPSQKWRAGGGESSRDKGKELA